MTQCFHLESVIRCRINLRGKLLKNLVKNWGEYHRRGNNRGKFIRLLLDSREDNKFTNAVIRQDNIELVAKLKLCGKGTCFFLLSVLTGELKFEFSANRSILP